jgi:hypothetical protein
VPANVTALVLKAGPGEDLICRAPNSRFKVNGAVQEGGVVSHYASLALAKATTAEEWLKETIALCEADVKQERLPEHLRLKLSIAGKPDQRLTGEPTR